MDFSLINCADRAEVRGECGRQGVFYLALGEAGLWKLHYGRRNKNASAVKLSREGDIVSRDDPGRREIRNLLKMFL